jgi:hypothetical protein
VRFAPFCDCTVDKTGTVLGMVGAAKSSIRRYHFKHAICQGCPWFDKLMTGASLHASTLLSTGLKLYALFGSMFSQYSSGIALDASVLNIS